MKKPKRARGINREFFGQAIVAERARGEQQGRLEERRLMDTELERERIKTRSDLLRAVGQITQSMADFMKAVEWAMTVEKGRDR